MSKVERFEDLEVWQLARRLTVKIYSLTKIGSFSRDYGLKEQIQRAAVSIVSNIAEGFDRRSNLQFLHFLEIAAGSASEVRAQLYVASDLGYITSVQFSEMIRDVEGISRMLTRFMQYLQNQPNRVDVK